MTTLLDTRTVLPSEREDYWSAGIANHFFPVSVESSGPRPFEACLSGSRVGPIGLSSISGAQHALRRTSRQVSDGDPDALLLYLVRRGSARIEQGDQACVLGPGDIGLHDTSRPSAFQTVDEVDLLAFSFPKWLLGPRASVLARRAATRLDSGRERIARVSAPFLAGIGHTWADSTMGEPVIEGVSEVLVGTVWSLFGGEEESLTLPARSEALLTRMRRYALEHLHDPGLGPDQIASAHFVSTRYVHKLFATGGCSVAAWIREQRLERALAEMRASSDASIASVAARWGYRDPASFSRAFRQAYGRSPRELRSAS